jgi:hypothetical protein
MPTRAPYVCMPSSCLLCAHVASSTMVPTHDPTACAIPCVPCRLLRS